MISPCVILFLNLKTRKTINTIIYLLKKEIEQFSAWNGYIIFSWLWSVGVTTPNASATIPRIILINTAWATRIVLSNDNPYMHTAFKMTVCHEMTHQENDFVLFEFFTKDSMFVNWINEVHADFGGVQKAFKGDVQKAIYAMKYKLSCKNKKDKDTRSHPSWKKRIEYISYFDFDAKLVEQVAFDVRCTNQKLIESVKRHYEYICLRR